MLNVLEWVGVEGQFRTGHAKSSGVGFHKHTPCSSKPSQAGQLTQKCPPHPLYVQSSCEWHVISSQVSGTIVVTLGVIVVVVVVPVPVEPVPVPPDVVVVVVCTG